MTITIGDLASKKPGKPQSAEMDAATELVWLAIEPGLALTDPDGLLKQLTKTVIETALNEVEGRRYSVRAILRVSDL